MAVSERRGGSFYFSVSSACIIRGMLYRVGVCYRLPGDIQGAVESLQAEGKARIYEEEMRIVSGVAYPAKKPPLPAAAAAEAPVPASPLQARKKARQRA